MLVPLRGRFLSVILRLFVRLESYLLVTCALSGGQEVSKPITGTKGPNNNTTGKTLVEYLFFIFICLLQ